MELLSTTRKVVQRNKMKAMVSYFISKISTDKRHTLPLFLSVTLATCVISLFAFMFVSQYYNNIEYAIQSSGSQHFIINEPLTEEQLLVLNENPDIEEIWQTGNYAYVKVHNVNDVYTISEHIAAELGLIRNGYGSYNITYNRSLLGLYGIKDPYLNTITALEQFILLASALCLMVMLLFVFIISGVYAMLNRARRTEIGLLQSIGATRYQIYFISYVEALCYFIPSIIIGIYIAYILQAITVGFRFSLLITILCVICTAITLFTATTIQIHRSLKGTIISKINVVPFRTNSYKVTTALTVNVKNPARSLAWLFYRSNRGAYRMSAVILTLFFSITLSFQAVIALIRANSYAEFDQEYYNLSLNTGSSLPSDSEISQLTESSENYVAYEMNTCTTPAFGNVDLTLNTGAWMYNGQYLLHTIIYGFDSKTFSDYLEYAGLPLDTEGPVLVNNTHGTSSNAVDISTLSNGLPLDSTSMLTLSARSAFDIENETVLELQIDAVSEVYPVIDVIYFPYDTVIIMDIEEFRRVDQYLYGENSMRSSVIRMRLPYQELSAIKTEISTLLNESDDVPFYSITTHVDRINAIEESLASTDLLFTALILFFGVLSLCNAINGIRTSLEMRAHEFHLLYSIGYSVSETRQMLLWEAFSFSLIPLILCLPITLTVSLLMKFILLKNATILHSISFFNWALSLLPILLCIIIIYIVYIRGAKLISSKSF